MGHEIGILVRKLYFCRKIAPFVGKIDKKFIFLMIIDWPRILHLQNYAILPVIDCPKMIVLEIRRIIRLLLNRKTCFFYVKFWMLRIFVIWPIYLSSEFLGSFREFLGLNEAFIKVVQS